MQTVASRALHFAARLCFCLASPRSAMKRLFTNGGLQTRRENGIGVAPDKALPRLNALVDPAIHPSRERESRPSSPHQLLSAAS